MRCLCVKNHEGHGLEELKGLVIVLSSGPNDAEQLTIELVNVPVALDIESGDVTGCRSADTGVTLRVTSCGSKSSSTCRPLRGSLIAALAEKRP